MIGIYKITSPSNRIYIGQSLNIKKRWDLYKKYHCKSQSMLYRSLKKHGSENHIFEVLEECSIEALNNLERFYQEKYRCTDKSIGLNLDLQKTDVLPYKRSQETKDKISRANMGHSHNKGFKCSDEVIAKRVMFHTGRKRSEESKEKMRAAAGYKSKPVCQYDLEMNFIAEYRSAHEAARQNKLQRPHISCCCNGVSKTHGGFKWGYKSYGITTDSIP